VTWPPAAPNGVIFIVVTGCGWMPGRWCRSVFA
jgi:hypothetical protein